MTGSRSTRAGPWPLSELPGRDRGATLRWNTGDAGDFIESHLFLKAQDQNFAIDCRDFVERLLHAGTSLGMQNLIEWRFAALIFDVEDGVFFGTGKGIDALRFFATVPVQHEVASDSE